jgi:hypothetical protein
VQGAGADVEVRVAGAHRFNVRGGFLRLHNAAGDSVGDLSAEAQYAFSHRRASFNARWRTMPESLQGIPAWERRVGGRQPQGDGEWRLAGRAYRSSNHALGRSFHSESEGASLGVRYFRQRWRLDVRGTHREWSYGEQPTVARTLNVSAGAPVGPLSLSAFAAVGEQRQDTTRRPTASYRGDLRWTGRLGTASWAASYFERPNMAPRIRTDLLGSLKLGDWELAGGAWATGGWTRAASRASGPRSGFPSPTTCSCPSASSMLRPIGASRPNGWARSASGRGLPCPSRSSGTGACGRQRSGRLSHSPVTKSSDNTRICPAGSTTGLKAPALARTRRVSGP